jgi:hypothetical protein
MNTIPFSLEDRAALERITAAGRRAGAWMAGLGHPGSAVRALATTIETTLTGLDRPPSTGPVEDPAAGLDPYAGPAGPVIGTVPLTSAETVAILAVAGCARIAAQAIDRPDRAELLHDLAAAIDDALDHAVHPDHTLDHVLGARRR